MQMKLNRQLRYALVIGLLVPAVAARCGGSDTAELLSDGDVSGSAGEFRALNYPITSDNYRKWLQAQSVLDTLDDFGPEVSLNPRKLTADDIDGVVETLEDRPDARAAIEGSGLTVRDYVLTTVALAQTWDAANTPDARFSSLPRENREWIGRQGSGESPIRTRPRARILDDSDTDTDTDTDTDSDTDSDSEDSDDSDRKRSKRGRGRDSDSDS